MHDETPKTTDQNRTPDMSIPSVTTAPRTNPTGGRLDDTDKPSDASRTQDTGSDSRGTDRSPDAAKRSTDSRSEKDRPNQKPIDPQGKPSPLTPKAPHTEGQGRPDQDRNQPGKTPDAKPAVVPNTTPNAV